MPCVLFYFCAVNFVSFNQKINVIILVFCQNVVAWTNLGVLYLKHSKIEVNNNHFQKVTSVHLILIVS